MKSRIFISRSGVSRTLHGFPFYEKLRPMQRLIAIFGALFLAGFALAQFPLEGTLGYALTAGTDPVYSNYYAQGGQVLLQLDDDDQDVTIVFAKDYLRDGDFEDDPRTGQGSGATSDYLEHLSPYSRDQWSNSGELDRDWNQTEGAGGSIEVTQTQLFGEDSVLFDASGGTAVVSIGSNMDVDTYSGGFTGWTENVNSGNGTVTQGTSSEHTAGGSEVILTGGSAHVDFSQSMTVVASTEYFVTFWVREGHTSDLCDFRVQEKTGGTDFLQADGTWASGEVDYITSSGTSYAQHVARFTTDAGITAVDLFFSADVTGDVCGIDDISMALVPGTFIQTGTLYPVLDTTADSYAIVVNHSDGGTDSVLQVQLRDAETCTGGGTCLSWDGSSDWTAADTWVTFANVATTSTQASETFLAHDAAHTADHRIAVRLRALMGTSEDVTLDNVFLVETTTHGSEGVMLQGLDDGADPLIVLLPPREKGRFVVDASGAIGLLLTGQFYGGN